MAYLDGNSCSAKSVHLDTEHHVENVPASGELRCDGSVVWWWWNAVC